MNKELLLLMRQEIVAMTAYSSARSEQSKEQSRARIWLDANENPLDDKLDEGEQYNRYPEPQPGLLVTLLSARYKVNPEQVLITRGSDEGVDLLMRLFCNARKDQIMICPPTYGMYKVAANIQGVDVVAVPLLQESGFTLDVPALLEKWQPNIKIIFLCSPNNPTGNLLAATDILAICRQLKGRAIVVVDEAYIEFAKGDSLSKNINEYPHLVVLRTLSKAYALAGVRCGATIADPIIIEMLKKIIAPYPVPKPTINIVKQQLLFWDINKSVALINSEKRRLMEFLITQPFVEKIWQSDANFILFRVKDAKRVMQVCLDNGIVLRDRSRDYGLANCIRVTIGTADENNRLMEALKHV